MALMEEDSSIETDNNGHSSNNNVNNNTTTNTTSSKSKKPCSRIVVLVVALAVLAVAFISTEYWEVSHSLGGGAQYVSTRGYRKNAQKMQGHFHSEEAATCAPFLLPKKRRVLLMGNANWEGFYNGTYLLHPSKKKLPLFAKPQRDYFSHGGENYVLATLDWALRKNGFVVDTTNDQIDDFTPKELSRYHRIVQHGGDWPLHLDDHPEILCKIRFLAFWGNTKPTPDKPWDPRQILTPYPDLYNTFLGFFVHSLAHPTTKPTTKNKKKKGKHAFVLGKFSNVFPKKHHHVLRALIGDGFTLHTTCKDENCALAEQERLQRNATCDPTCGGLPKEMVFHGEMTPAAYAGLMDRMAFLMGFGAPHVSPSPLVGMAHGAAWLNPLKGPPGVPERHQRAQELLHDYPSHWRNESAIISQHWPLANLGAPYVYNVDLDNATTVLEAARWAVQHRFASYTPPDYTPEAMMARTCALMADDAICTCPNPVFGFQRYHMGKEASTVDCHGSTYVRNFRIQEENNNY